MTAFPWKLFKNGQEIVFPKGARRYVTVDVQQIQNNGAVEFDWNGNAVWTGDEVFRRHFITISCSDQTAAPISDLWQGQDVRLEAPIEFAVRGPTATLAYDPVPGSVYGVDANDTPVGSTASGSRNVSIAGAVAIRFRPIIDCKVLSRSGPGGSQGRANAGWSIQLVELNGNQDEEDNADRITIAPSAAVTLTEGESYSLNIGALTTATPGLVPSYSISLGSLPSGVSLNSTTGLVSGTVAVPGVYVYSVMASDGDVSGVQTFALNVNTLRPDRPAIFSGGTLRSWTPDYPDAQPHVAGDFTVSGSLTVTRSGWADLYGWGGGAGGGNINNNNGSACGGGGAGQFLVPRRVWLEEGVYTVTVAAVAASGTNGNSTTVTGPGGFSITLVGGGAGGPAYGQGLGGASSGGASGREVNLAARAPISTETGNAGGSSVGGANRAAAGGGGWSAAGLPGRNFAVGGDGGPGIRFKLWGWLSCCGGGGGGSNGAGGLGSNGGGNGGAAAASGTNAEANSGSGGGGAGHRASGSAVLVGGQGAGGRFIFVAEAE